MALVALVPLLGVANAPPETHPPCTRATVAMVDDVDSAHAHPGDSFRIRTVEPVTAADGSTIPAETAGFGVVAIAHHADRGGRGGYVVIETRYIALANGTHLPVTIDWASAARATATGSSQNIPGIVGAVPLVGYVLGPYGFLHHGRDIIIPRDARIPVILGDDVASGACRVVPLPTASAAPSASSPSPSAASPEPSASPSPTAGMPMPSVSGIPTATPHPAGSLPP